MTSPKAPTASLIFSCGRLCQVESACSQSRAADLKDAVAIQRAANARCLDETGRRAGEGADTRMTARGKKL